MSGVIAVKPRSLSGTVLQYSRRIDFKSTMVFDKGSNPQPEVHPMAPGSSVEYYEETFLPGVQGICPNQLLRSETCRAEPHGALASALSSN